MTKKEFINLLKDLQEHNNFMKNVMLNCEDYGQASYYKGRIEEASFLIRILEDEKYYHEIRELLIKHTEAEEQVKKASKEAK